MKPKTVRCAIYTRKSTEHNLELEFNSLHAQREACEAYIKSQMHEGWELVPDKYDDGAFSGATLDRPDLQRLLSDIVAGRLDTVVVYKVDRLTRSLTDFAKLVEVFERYGVSFVSITQAFNTTSSTGRLTLNVLLSFAQFEREVIGERVRDKIAASKKKGLFMGGGVPFGYTNQNKKLIIVPADAERVRWIFQTFLEVKSVDRLVREVCKKNIRTKLVTLTSGKQRGGILFRKSPLTYLLKNPCYVGEIRHKGRIYPADHEPIIDRITFDAVQATFAAMKSARKARIKRSLNLLAGILFDKAGNRMAPIYSRKKGARYRYYVSQAVSKSGMAEARNVCRVPARDVEFLIERLVREQCPETPDDLRSLIESRVTRATVMPETLDVELTEKNEAEDTDARPFRQVVRLPWTRKPFRVQKGVVFSPNTKGPVPVDKGQAKDAILVAVYNARRWMKEVQAGRRLSKIAEDEGFTVRHVRSLIQMAFVSPRLVKGILDENALPGLTTTALLQSISPLWAVQELRYLERTTLHPPMPKPSQP